MISPQFTIWLDQTAAIGSRPKRTVIRQIQGRTRSIPGYRYLLFFTEPLSLPASTRASLLPWPLFLCCGLLTAIATAAITGPRNVDGLLRDVVGNDDDDVRIDLPIR
jgi:hypothetical protein